jgi:hypothetical protein
MNLKSIIYKALIISSFSLTLMLIYRLAIWVIFTDISLEPINKQHVTEISSPAYKARLPVTLISYADGPEIFYKNQNFQALSGLNKGIDQFILYRRNLIAPDFYKKNVHILQEKFGAGYWLWKPHIILQTMKRAHKNSIILYMDSGLSITGDLKAIFDALEKNDIIIAEDGAKTQKPFLDSMVAKETIKTIGINLKDGEHIKPLWAAFIAVRNTENAQKFIETWLSFCEQKELITQYLNDQMLLGLVAHKYPNNVYTMPEPIITGILTWHHRKTNPDGQNKSLLPCLAKHIEKIDAKLINLKIFRVIRDYILTHVTNTQKRQHPSCYK